MTVPASLSSVHWPTVFAAAVLGVAGGVISGSASAPDTLKVEMAGVVRTEGRPSPLPPSPPDPGPAPEPEPGPAPEPEPGPDAGGFAEVTAAVPRWVQSVTGRDVRGEAMRTAELFEASAGATEARRDRGVQANALAATADSKRRIGGAFREDRLRAWEPFRGSLGDAVGDLYADGRLRTPSDWADLFRAVAAGLRAAADLA